MKRLLQMIGLTIALAVPGAAFAQGGTWHQPPGAQTNVPYQQHPYAYGQAPSGVLRGTVVRTNIPNGLVFLRSRGQILALRGMPGQLAGINPGDRVRLPYQNYDGALWLDLSVGGGQAAFGTYGQQGRIRGQIQQINRRAGIIVVNGYSYRVHPAYLGRLGIGEFVRVRFVNVGQRSWVTRIRPDGRFQPRGYHGGGYRGY